MPLDLVGFSLSLAQRLRGGPSLAKAGHRAFNFCAKAALSLLRQRMGKCGGNVGVWLSFGCGFSLRQSLTPSSFLRQGYPESATAEEGQAWWQCWGSGWFDCGLLSFFFFVSGTCSCQRPTPLPISAPRLPWTLCWSEEKGQVWWQCWIWSSGCGMQTVKETCDVFVLSWGRMMGQKSFCFLL